MANHIHTLTTERDTLRAAVSETRRACDEFRAFLLGPKFQLQADGQRGDWIATADVLRWLADLGREVDHV